MTTEQFIEVFIVEAHDLLVEIDQAALSLQLAGPSQETVNQLFRAFHTIKGSAGVCGLDGIVEFTHHVENLLDLVRDGKIPFSPKLVDLVLRSEDQIAAMLAAEQGDPPPPRASTDKLIADVCAYAGLAVIPLPPKKTKVNDTADAFIF
jgi:two-component system chemotaxis sensor kinase CheA